MLHVDPANLAVDATVADAAGPALVRAAVEQQVVMLTRLAQIGINISEAIERRAVAQALIAERAAEPGAAAGEACADRSEPGVVYQRVARAVRLTVALQSKVLKDLIALDQGEAQARQMAEKARDRTAAAPAAEDDPLGRRRERIDRIVRRVIEAEEPDEDDVERLSGEAWERLIDEDVYGDVLARPIGEIVARVCEDLRLSPDWKALAREAWAVEEAASGAPGSPFVARAGPQSASP